MNSHVISPYKSTSGFSHFAFSDSLLISDLSLATTNAKNYSQSRCTHHILCCILLDLSILLNAFPDRLSRCEPLYSCSKHIDLTQMLRPNSASQNDTLIEKNGKFPFMHSRIRVSFLTFARWVQHQVQ